MHFLGTVIGPETESEVDDALARWDENKDVEPYVVEYREDFLERAREWASRRPDVDGSDEDALLGRFALYTGAELDEDGNEVSTMPEDAFYDWYELGGRWSGETASLQGLTVDGSAPAPRRTPPSWRCSAASPCPSTTETARSSRPTRSPVARGTKGSGSWISMTDLRA